MTAVSVSSRPQARIAVRSGSAVALGVGDETVALAGGDPVEQALAVADMAPRALSLQPQEPFGVAYQGRRLFTAIGAVAGRRGEAGPEGQPGQPGPPGEANIAGYGFNIDQLSQGDMLVFNGSAWSNEHKTSLLDGGNF